MSRSAWERVADALAARGGRRPPERGGDVACPAHDDRRPSLSVARADDRVLLHCQAGCSHADVLAALGLTDADLFDAPNGARPNGGRPRIVRTYPYVDAAGTVLYEVVRYEPKQFRQRRPAPGGGWVWSLDGVPRVLYRLPAVLEAVEAGRTVWVVEGEKDADALVRAGQVATCNPQGAGKWSRCDRRALHGAAEVVVWADDDAVGHAHARAVAEDLAPHVGAVRVVRSRLHKDAAEHLGAGRSLDDLIPLPEPEGPPEAPRMRSEPNPVSGTGVGVGGAQIEPQGPLVEPAALPPEFWAARASLRWVQRAAQAARCSPDAVLGAVLARLAVWAPYTVRLPWVAGGPPGGSSVGLGLLVGLVGPSGAGKSTASDVAVGLVPIDSSDVVDGLPLGSGEGLVEALFDTVEVVEDGVTRRERRQVRHGAYVVVDEGEVLGAVGKRQGSTLFPTLRSAWSGGVLGQANATAERRRVVPAGAHVYGVVVCLQPTAAAALLDDLAGGLPQRLLWLPATDPAAPDVAPPWPDEPLRLRLHPDELARARRPGPRHVLEVAPPVRAEIERAHLGRLRGDPLAACDPLDSHADLGRLKVAALLALLEGTVEIDEEDWSLAGLVYETSRATRAQVIAACASAAAERERSATRRHAERSTAAEAAVVEARVADAQAAIRRHVGKAPGELSPAVVRSRLSRRQREVFEEALTGLLDAGTIVERPGVGKDQVAVTVRLWPAER